VTTTSGRYERSARRPVDKFSERRSQLAAAALKTLSELGYARTSLREIAQNSEFSHGVLHYYFTNKVDLITACVTQYKAECVKRYDGIVANAMSAQQLREDFGRGMAATLRDDAPYHRLWYDLRNQSLFEPAYRDDVTAIDSALERMIWRIVSRYSELDGRALLVPSKVAYALFDGLFQHALQQHLAGEPTAPDALDEAVVRVISTLVG
jgi:AcrR family transcriptional regulator